MQLNENQAPSPRAWQYAVRWRGLIVAQRERRMEGEREEEREGGKEGES